METRIITLKSNQALLDIALYAVKTPNDLRERIIGSLLELKIVMDSDEYCGQDLNHIFEESEFDLEIFTVYCLGICTPRVLKMMRGVMIWGLMDDCGDCGCEMIKDDYDEFKVCDNLACGCSINIDYTPDPDIGRDDCVNKLIKNYKKERIICQN